jgi:hypothetical protein
VGRIYDVEEFYDATANILRQVREMMEGPPEKRPSGSFKVTVSSLEAPSNVLAFRLDMAAFGSDLRMTMNVQRVPAPDPRVPIAPVKYQLWDYTGTDPSPALPAPSEEVTSAIADVAAIGREDLRWAAASRTAEHLGPQRAGDILAVMVHPPPVPTGERALAWLPRVQRAAAEVIAWVDSGWDGSARAEALLSVLHGPQDWATVAAIRVLARLGRENQRYSPDIHDAFGVLADHRPDSGDCCWERPLYRAWLSMPHLFEKERKDLEKRLRNFDKRSS